MREGDILRWNRVGTAIFPCLKACEDTTSIETSSHNVEHFYRLPLLPENATNELLKHVQTKISSSIIAIKTEQCFNIGCSSPLDDKKVEILKWILSETYELEKLQKESLLELESLKLEAGRSSILIEVGLLSFTTAWSANAVAICKALTLFEVTRIERSRRYLLILEADVGTLE